MVRKEAAIFVTDHNVLTLLYLESSHVSWFSGVGDKTKNVEETDVLIV